MEGGSINATGKGELLEGIERGEHHCRADLIYLPVNVVARRLIYTLQRWAPRQAKTTFFGATLMVKWSQKPCASPSGIRLYLSAGSL